MKNFTQPVTLALVIAMCAPDLQAQMDTIPPVITCPADLMISTDAGECSSIVQFAPPTAVDDQSTASVFQVSGPPSGSIFPQGLSLVAFAAMDSSGNQAQCAFTIHVIDNEPPLTLCPADTTVVAPPGAAGATVVFPNAAIDNCPGATAVYTPASGSFFPLGSTPVLVYATDASDNANDPACRFRVNVQPAIPVAPSHPGTSGILPVITVDPGSITAVVQAPSGGSLRSRLMRLSGEVIWERTTPVMDGATEVRIDMTGREEGIYLLQVVVGDQCSVSRLAFTPR